MKTNKYISKASFTLINKEYNFIPLLLLKRNLST